ncbi:MAG: hypothetical protein IVW57_17420, partial [Ktedonobacterales bacterium]|nr:hypothetical protein [Ktedonobacterales bacterium]
METTFPRMPFPRAGLRMTTATARKCAARTGFLVVAALGLTLISLTGEVTANTLVPAPHITSPAATDALAGLPNDHAC